MTAHRSTASRLALASVTAALALAACNQTPTAPAGTQPVTGAPIAALPLATAAPPAPLATAPAVAAAGRRRGSATCRGRRSAIATSTARRSITSRSATPRPTIPSAIRVRGHGCGAPTAGRTASPSALPQGERYYYYAAGADAPFYVSDPDGGYAYDNGELVAAYGPDGEPLAGF